MYFIALFSKLNEIYNYNCSTYHLTSSWLDQNLITSLQANSFLDLTSLEELYVYYLFKPITGRSGKELCEPLIEFTPILFCSSR